MAIDFPDNPSDGDIVTRSGKLFTYSAVKNTWTPGNAASVGWTIINTTTEVQVGVKYLVDTSSSAITLTLPLTPDQGAQVTIAEAAGNAENNNITINRNGNNIESVSANLTIATNYESVTLTYYDSTVGWVKTETNQGTAPATGGGGSGGSGGTTGSTDEEIIIAYTIALG